MINRLLAIAFLLSAVVLSACGDSRYSVEIGAVPTAAPPPTVAPTAAPVVIVVPAPAQAPASDNALPLILLAIMSACVAFATVMALMLIPRRPYTAPPPPPAPTFLPPFTVDDEPASIPLINVTNHYHYHASAPPIGAPEMPPPPELPDNWTIARKAEYLLSAGYTTDEARRILDSRHSARQLPPPKGSR